MVTFNINRKYRLVFAGFLALFFSLLTLPPALGSAKKKVQEQNLESYALLVGSCFNESGFSLGGVNIVIELQVPPGQKQKARKWMATSDVRGEFAVRLPAGRNQFRVKANKGGFKSQEQIVSFAEDERQDIHFTLAPLGASK